jgi:hypothetical protein
MKAQCSPVTVQIFAKLYLPRLQARSRVSEPLPTLSERRGRRRNCRKRANPLFPRALAMSITVTYRGTAQRDIEILFFFGTDMREKIR